MEQTMIENLNDAALHIGTLDNATEAELFYGNTENPQPVDNWKGIYNMQAERLATVASKGYRIIQHNDVLQSVIETLGGLNIDVMGVLKNRGNRFIADLVFKDEGGLIQDDASGVKLGIRVMNSYDKTCSFRLEMFGYRVVCRNGMVLGQGVGVSNSVYHIGKDKQLDEIKQVTEKFIHDVIKSSETLQRHINEAMADSVEWEACCRIVDMIGKNKKHRQELINRLEELRGGKVTRWQIYNAVTHYVTHGESLMPTLEAYFEKKSKHILSTPLHQLEAKLPITI